MVFMTSFRIVVRAVTRFFEHDGAQMGAALAYYAVFSTAPLLILAVKVASLFFGEEQVQFQLHLRLNQWLQPELANEVLTWMAYANQPTGTALATVFGIGFLILGNLGLFLHLRRCLYVIWELKPPRGSSWLLTLLNYGLAILAIFCVSLLLLLSLVVSTGTTVLIREMGDKLPGGGALWHWVELGVSFLLLTLFFAVVYKVLSGQQLAWRYVWYGSFVTAVLFTIGKALISLYLAYTSTTSIYGAAGSVVVFLVWVYYSSQIAFFGAELIQARRTRSEWLHAAARAQTGCR